MGEFPNEGIEQNKQVYFVHCADPLLGVLLLLLFLYNQEKYKTLLADNPMTKFVLIVLVLGQFE